MLHFVFENHDTAELGSPVNWSVLGSLLTGLVSNASGGNIGETRHREG